LLREGGRLNLFASAAVRNTVEQHLGLTQILEHFCGTAWHEPPIGEFAPLSAPPKSNQTLLYRAIRLHATPPPFTKAGSPESIHSVAYQFLNPQTNRRLLVAPDIAEITDELSAAMANSDAVLFDGTFWSADELAQVRPGARTARDMGHVTIRDCSLQLLAGLAARHKVYIHINNTNPVLSPESPERAAVEAAGIVVGYDGMEFEL
jgi:pyrroloquinoline quinone biosynthesis protein B